MEWSATCSKVRYLTLVIHAKHNRAEVLISTPCSGYLKILNNMCWGRRLPSSGKLAWESRGIGASQPFHLTLEKSPRGPSGVPPGAPAEGAFSQTRV